MKPKFITFTGADDQTNIGDMAALSEKYPIEWAILFSMKRQGSPRYPSSEWIDGIRNHARFTGARINSNFNLAAHLCGAYAEDILEGNLDFSILNGFKRVQINTKASDLKLDLIKSCADQYNFEPIFQCRFEFPDDNRVSWLYDNSGGNGIVPKSWPAPAQQNQFIGYAGGLGPDNIGMLVNIFDVSGFNYWIDMETNVRTDNKFDISKCEAVCKIVYGEK